MNKIKNVSLYNLEVHDKKDIACMLKKRLMLLSAICLLFCFCVQSSVLAQPEKIVKVKYEKSKPCNSNIMMLPSRPLCVNNNRLCMIGNHVISSNNTPLYVENGIVCTSDGRMCTNGYNTIRSNHTIYYR